MSSHIHYARFVKKKTIAQDIVEFYFEMEEELRFRPGQFVSVQVAIDSQDNPVLRSYSIASSFTPSKEIRLILRMIEEGQGTRFFGDLSKGDTMRFTGPMGFFVNELSHPGDIVYAATGTGIAPIYPMIQEILARNENGKILLFWGVRHEEDLFFQEELADLKKQSTRLASHLYVSRPKVHYPGQKGRIIQPILNELTKLSEPTFYLCGNGQMIQELKTALVERGVHRKRQIRTEAFFD